MEPLRRDESQSPRTRLQHTKAEVMKGAANNISQKNNLRKASAIASRKSMPEPITQGPLAPQYLRSFSSEFELPDYLHKEALNRILNAEMQAPGPLEDLLRQIQRLAELQRTHPAKTSFLEPSDRGLGGHGKVPQTLAGEIALKMLMLLIQVADKDMTLCDRLLRCLAEQSGPNPPALPASSSRNGSERLRIRLFSGISDPTLTEIAQVFQEHDLVPTIEVEASLNDIELDTNLGLKSDPFALEILAAMRQTESGRQRLSALGPRAVRRWVSHNTYTNPTPKFFYVTYLHKVHNQANSRNFKELVRLPNRTTAGTVYVGAFRSYCFDDTDLDMWFRFLVSLNLVDLDGFRDSVPYHSLLLQSDSLPVRAMLSTQDECSIMAKIYRLAELRARDGGSLGFLIFRDRFSQPEVPSVRDVADQIREMQTQIAQYSIHMCEKFLALLKNEVDRCHDGEADWTDRKKSIFEAVKFPEEIKVLNDGYNDTAIADYSERDRLRQTEDGRAMLASEGPVAVGKLGFETITRSGEQPRLFYKTRRISQECGKLSTETTLTLLSLVPKSSTQDPARAPKRLRLDDKDGSSSSTDARPAKQRATRSAVASGLTFPSLLSSSTEVFEALDGFSS